MIWPWRPRTPSLPPDRLEIIVPVCNAARWVGVILNAYRALGLRPLFILDERSADQTGSILAQCGARVMTACGAYPRVESLLCDAIPRLRTEWVLRFDDDEMPSRALLAWVAGNLDVLPGAVAGFPRRWVWREREGSFVTSYCAAASRVAGGDATDDRQYRLFRPKAVTLTDELHTPGFLPATASEAPADAVLYHFDWLVRDHAARERKVANYELQSPGTGKRFAAYYLPEDQDPAFYQFLLLDDQDVAMIAKKLLRRATG